MKSILISAFVLTFSACVFGQSFTLEVENDLLQGDDSDYTHGTRMMWTTPETLTPKWVSFIPGKTPFFREGEGAYDYSFVFGQNMFTPDDIAATNLIEDDRPYAGYTYIGVVGRKTMDGQNTFVEIDLGIVGPCSYAEQTQKEFHRLINGTIPAGWDNQLHNEPTIQLQYWESRGVTLLGEQKHWSIDMTPRLGGLLGNVQVAGCVGADARFGYNMPTSQGPGVIVPTAITPKYKKSRNYIYVFFGAEGRAYAWNIFLDGNTDGNSHSVEKEPLVSDIRAGAGFGFKDFNAILTIIQRSPEYVGQDEAQEYTSLTLTYRF